MKKYNILVLLVMVIFCSCEDYLEKNPNYEATSEGYFISEKAAQESRVGIYTKTPSHFTDNKFMWDGMTDQLYDQYDWNEETSVSRGVLTPSSRGIVSGFFADAYKVISTANDHIANIQAMDESLFEDMTKAQYIADAQFFKAFYYFYLTEVYGGVPLYKEKVENIEDYKIAQSSKAEIVSYILQELDVAIQNLPQQLYNGYITKGSAQALKAKILLQNKRWDEAASAALEVINSGVFSLHPDYFNIFIKKGQAGNKEIMYATEFQYPEVAHSLTRLLVHSAGATPRQEFVDAYLMVDGLPVSQSTLESANYQNRDPRLYLTVRLPDDVWYDAVGQPIGFEPTQTGYYVKKFLDVDIVDNNSIHIGGTSEQGIVHLRYADVLLTYAEAKFRSGGFNQSVADLTINPIRQRVGMATVNNVNSLSDNEKWALIEYERNVELAFEGHHYFDLKRWGKQGETMTSLTDPIGYTIVWKDHFSLWPFTDSELNLNPNLVQNPGY